MLPESNTIPPESADTSGQPGVRGLVLVTGAMGVALNRTEDEPASGDDVVLCFVGLPADVPDWIQLIPAGESVGADGRTFVNNAPDQFLAASSSYQRIPGAWAIDFDHQTQLATNAQAGGRAPAAGWIVELQNRDGAIWGRVEWTDLGSDAVRKRHYRGISPVFAFNKASKRAIGLMTAALTNNPNLDLALNARQPSQERNSMDWLKKQLGLAENATDDAVKTALNAFVTLAGALAGMLGMDVKAATALNAQTLQATLAQKFGTGDVLVALCSKAGLKADAGADAIVAALQALATPDPSKWVSMEAHSALKSELDKRRQAEVTEIVDQALKDRRLWPSQKDWALNYAQRDLDGFKKFVGDAPTRLTDPPAPTGTSLDAADPKAVAAAAQAHMADQAKLGITVTAVQAVAHVTKKGA